MSEPQKIANVKNVFIFEGVQKASHHRNLLVFVNL